MSEEKNSDVLSSWLSKKGSKWGFWHKRWVVLKIKELELIVFKSDDLSKLERVIKIDNDTECEMFEKEKPPRFVVKPKNDRQIVLANDDKGVVNTWVTTIKTCTMTTPGLTMDDFNVISVIGRGYYGKVTMCQRKKNNKIYAIKSIHKNRLIKAHKVSTVISERFVLMNIRHPFIVKLHFAFQTASKVYMGLDYIPGGDLAFHLMNRGSFPPEDARLYAAEIALALDYLHKSGLVYRDLKPENILLEADGHIKLADFGLVKNLKYTKTTSSFCGTPEYIAPEIIQQENYGTMVDWWSFGVMLYQFVFGNCPWEDQNVKLLFNKIISAPLVFPEGADPDTVDLLSHLIERDPEKRSGMDFIMKHPFFKGLDFQDVFDKKIQPSFKPDVKPVDTKSDQPAKPVNFESVFLKEDIQESYATPIRPEADAFEGFSYVNQDYLHNSPNSGTFDQQVKMGNYKPTAL